MESAQRTVADKISAFVNDPDVRLFEERFKRTTDLFEAMDVAKYENPHSFFIAWILDSRRNPGLGLRPIEFLLQYLITDILNKRKEEYGDEVLRVLPKMLVGDYKLLSCSCRREVQAFVKEKDKEKDGYIDIIASCAVLFSSDNGQTERQTLNVVIENKVGSTLHDRQLHRYRAFMDNHHKGEINLYALLAPDLHAVYSKGEEKQERDDAYVPVSYQTLTDQILQPLLNSAETPIRAKVLINEYMHTLSRIEIKKKTMTIAINPTDRELLKAFHKKHGELIEDMLNMLAMSARDEGDEETAAKLEDSVKQSKKARQGSVYFTIEGDEGKKYQMGEFVRRIVELYIEWFIKSNHREPAFEEVVAAFPAKETGCGQAKFIHYSEYANEGDTIRRYFLVRKIGDVEICSSKNYTSETIKKFQNFVSERLASKLNVTFERHEESLLD